MTNRYEQPVHEGKQRLLEAEANDTEELHALIIGAALYEEDFDFVERACLRLSRHRDEGVRGNAILCFGHLARLWRRLGPESIAAVRAGLGDASEYVRGHADAAADDVAMFLAIDVR